MSENNKICQNCGSDLSHKPKSRKYCDATCYRQHKARTFGNCEYEFIEPEIIEMYLKQELMHCLVKGCEWTGVAVCIHMAKAHGIPKREVKIACGFNISQGIVTPTLHKKLSERKNVGAALNDEETRRKTIEGREAYKEKKRDTYISRQYKQSRKKICEDIIKENKRGTRKPPTAVCKRCGVEFVNKNAIYFAGKYCSIECRDKEYKSNYDAGLLPSGIAKGGTTLVCDTCGTQFHGNRQQVIRQQEGLPVVCSLGCRQLRAGVIAGKLHTKRRPPVYETCPVCKKTFHKHKKEKKYCSHKCAITMRHGYIDYSHDDHIFEMHQTQKPSVIAAALNLDIKEVIRAIDRKRKR